MRACEVAGGEGRYYARGYCEKHYARLRKFGDPLRTKGTPHGLTVMERFMRHVRVDPNGCWIWTGNTYGGPAHRESHGSWRPDQRKSPVGAHVWLYEQTV